MSDFDVPDLGAFVSGPVAAGDALLRRSLLKDTWLVRNMIPAGSMTLIGGPKGGAKTYLLAWLAAASIVGSLPAWEGEERPVIYLGSDSGAWEEFSERVWAALGGSPWAFERLNSQILRTDLAGLNLSTDAGQIVSYCNEHHVKLVLCDPLASYHGGDSHTEAEVRRNLEPWFYASEQYGITTVGTHHLRKGEGSFIDRLTGSGAYVGIARSVCAFAPAIGARKRGERSLVLAKSNRAVRDIDTQPSLDFAFRTVSCQMPDADPIEVSALYVINDSGPTHIWQLELDLTTGPEDATAAEVASEVLLNAYSIDTGVPMSDVYSEGRKHGFQPPRMRDAIRRCGGAYKPKGFQGQWVAWIPRDPDLAAAMQARDEWDSAQQTNGHVDNGSAADAFPELGGLS